MPNPRDEVLKRIEKKRSEIAGLEIQIREATSYIQALEDMIKLLPRENNNGGLQTDQNQQTLRAGSVVAKARDAILAAGKPLHINDILAALGKPTDNTTKAGVSGSISAYFRRGEIFTRPAPNTFGLLELSGKRKHERANVDTEDEPPLDFGIETEEEDNNYP